MFTQSMFCLLLTEAKEFTNSDNSEDEVQGVFPLSSITEDNSKDLHCGSIFSVGGAWVDGVETYWRRLRQCQKTREEMASV